MVECTFQPVSEHRTSLLRIELGDECPTAITHRLRGGRYVEVARAEPGERLRLTEPFPVDVDLAEPASRTRPAE